MWTGPAADSADPGPASAPGWCAPAPGTTRHSCSSASRSPPWSHVVQSEDRGTDAPTGKGGQKWNKISKNSLNVFA